MESGAAEKEKASAEQLLEYIKKQKLKIKRLQTENEALVKVKVAEEDGSNDGGNVERLCQQKNKAAVANMLNLARYLSQLCKSATPNSIQSAFSHWKVLNSLSRLEAVSKEMETAKAASTAMEQRIAKLKALLARTHQANQRNLEEFDNLKKAQKNAEGELKNAEIKTNAELNSLKEVVRASSITSAFQYDIDILIQNAGRVLSC